MDETIEAPSEAEPESEDAPEAETPKADDDDDDLEADDDTASDDEPEPAAEPEPEGPSEAEMEKLFKRLDTRKNTYVRGVAELAAEGGIPLVPCAVCADGQPGFIIDPRVEPLSDVALAAMRAILGIGQEPPFANDPDAAECPRCEGWGRTRTGSKVDGKRLIPCSECNGLGWVGPARDLTPEQVAALPNYADTYVEPDNEPPADVDAWNTPRGHPEFGLMPQYRDPGWQERIEAYRAGEPAPIMSEAI